MHVLQGDSESHDCIADELQLFLEDDVVLGQLVFLGTLPHKLNVVWRGTAIRVPALEVVLPELCKTEVGS